MMFWEAVLYMICSIVFIPWLRLVERYGGLAVANILVAVVVGGVAPLLISGASNLVTLLVSDLQPTTQLFLLILVLVLAWLQLYRTHSLHLVSREIFIFKKKVKIEWPESWEAETTKSVLFSFTKAVRSEEVVSQVFCETEQVNTTEIWSEDGTVMEVVFPSHTAGQYKFFLFYSGRTVRGAPWVRTVKPSDPDPATIRLVNIPSTSIVIKSGASHTVRMEVRDQHCNHIDVKRQHCDVTSVLVDSEACYEIGPCQTTKNIEIKFTFSTVSSGAFPAAVKYAGDIIGNIQLLVLPPAKLNSINNYISKMGWNSYYEVSLLSLQGENQKCKTVYVYLTDKQMIIREFYLRLIPHRLASYRVNPKVKLSIDDEVLTISQHGETDRTTQIKGEAILLLAATYYTILLRRVGGSETFQEKKQFFNKELTKYHEDLNHRHLRLPIRVERANIFESTWKATRYFLQSDWARLFEISFSGEPGIDQGGPRREWYELLTRHIFHPDTGLFLPVEDGQSGLQPNPHPPSQVKLKHYRLAGKLVGKALYETAQGDTYRLNLNARLARSFLAQMIGIGTHYTMLEEDAPDLWRNKVQFILNNEVEFLELTFSQEEMRPGGQLETVELVPGGARLAVTESNKKSYVVSLSHHLLTARIRSQLAAFLEGLHTLVPDHLLSLWDESELELLLCGVREFSLADLQQHHSLVGPPHPRFSLVLGWFWQVLSHLPPEDLARFVRFCTGSSLLPPGGWAELKPRLQISWSGAERGSLPSSHTCFNMILLPDSQSYHALERVLLLAVREGSEGFMLA